MKNALETALIYTILLFIFSAIGCSIFVEEEEKFYQNYIENQSQDSLKILLYEFNINGDIPYDSVSIGPNERKEICGYFAFEWSGFACEITRIDIIFPNSKGYICTKGSGTINDSMFCLLSKDPFSPERLPNNGNGTLLIIDQSDFENAFDI